MKVIELETSTTSEVRLPNDGAEPNLLLGQSGTEFSPTAPDLAPCGLAWAETCKWMTISLDGSPAVESVAPQRRGAGLVTYYLDGKFCGPFWELTLTCSAGHVHGLRWVDGTWRERFRK